MKTCRCIKLGKRKQARPSLEYRFGKLVCAKCGCSRAQRVCRFVMEPKYRRQQRRDKEQRLQGERQFVRRLRAKLKHLKQIDKHVTDDNDREARISHQGFEVGIEAVEDFLTARNKR